MTHPRQLALVALPLVLLLACTGDDDEDAKPTDPQPYIDAGVASLTADAEMPFDQETATCISAALVDVIGADALARANITPEEFAAADSFELLAVDIPDDGPAQLRTALDGCDSAGAFSDAFVTALGVEITPEDVACLADGLDHQAVNDAMADGFLGTTDEAAQQLQDTVETALLDAVIRCPGIVTATFLAQAPGTVTPEMEACVSQVIAANPERVRAAFGGDTAAAEAFGTDIGTACAAALGS